MLRIVPPRTMRNIRTISDIWDEKKDAKDRHCYARVVYSSSTSREWGYGESTWNGSVQSFKAVHRERSVQIPRYNRIKRVFDDVVEDASGHGDLGIYLQFAGVIFLSDFTKVDGVANAHVQTSNSTTALMRICEYKGVALRVDIVEKKDSNSLFSDVIPVSKLQEYDPCSMEVLQKNGIIAVGYRPFKS